MEILLVYPHQLFLPSSIPLKGKHVFLIEDPLFFFDEHYPAKFHKKKLVLHRASMRAYYKQIKKSHPCTYIPYAEAKTKDVFDLLNKKRARCVHLIEPSDFILRMRVERESKRLNIPVVWHESPNFVTSLSELESYFDSEKTYFQTNFYMWQRKRLDILMDGDKPYGGKWTYDVDNRKKLPKDLQPKDPVSFSVGSDVKEAMQYVEEHFGEHPGEVEGFDYPINRRQALALLDDFIENRLSLFGPYQDAMTTRSLYVYHSKLSSSLNIGLLSAEEVVNKVLDYADTHRMQLSSLEGFIRQVIGWREFVRGVYMREGVRQRATNFFKFSRKLSNRWYEGTLGIDPVDDAIKKVSQTGYAHHIERLMVLGNFMLLCEIDPDEVYRWFMEMFIDSYDWVMVPNVYGMSQYADGGLMVTKPYISGSNYIRKMSDTKRGDWCDVWDALYWRFLYRHQKKMEGNPRMSLMLKLLSKMNSKTLEGHLKIADRFLGGL